MKKFVIFYLILKTTQNRYIENALYFTLHDLHILLGFFCCTDHIFLSSGHYATHLVNVFEIKLAALKVYWATLKVYQDVIQVACVILYCHLPPTYLSCFFSVLFSKSKSWQGCIA